MSSVQLLRDLAKSSLGDRWDTLLSEAVSVIAYGSQATGEADLDSDLDLLAIKEVVPAPGKNKWNYSEEIRGVHVAWFPTSIIETPKFLGSEIANAARQSGVLLHGTWDWKERAVLNLERVLKQKARYVYSLLRSREGASPAEIPALDRKIHRQLNRWLLLRDGDSSDHSGPSLDAMPLSHDTIKALLIAENLFSPRIRAGLKCFFKSIDPSLAVSVPFTFSIWCRSGFVGNYLDRCECHRCRKSRGEEVTDESEALAEKKALEADAKYDEWMRNFLSRYRK